MAKKDDRLYAESINYWQTSRSSPDTWIRRARKQIETIGGIVIAEAFGNEPGTGRAAFMLTFELGDDRFRAVWPVLPSRNGKEGAARVQAATMLFHDVKQRCISASVLGGRSAFFSYLELPDGRTASDLATPELAQHIPDLLALQHRNRLALTEG